MKLSDAEARPNDPPLGYTQPIGIGDGKNWGPTGSKSVRYRCHNRISPRRVRVGIPHTAWT
jgi:hypothetical protein